MTGPIFPGGTSMSRLRVYDWPAADGEALVGSGTPHLHTASSEGYVVLSGTGRVQTLSAQGYAEHTLAPGAVVWFDPGVVHRLLNDGGLELLVVMSNAGLPEAGDAVLTFGPEVLADAEQYARLATLPTPDGRGPDDEQVAALARQRRDAALSGYHQLRDQVRAEGGGALAPLHRAAARLVSSRVDAWREIVAGRAQAQVADTVAALAGLAQGDPTHLADAAVAATAPTTGEASDRPWRYGMCGRLQTWDLTDA